MDLYSERCLNQAQTHIWHSGHPDVRLFLYLFAPAVFLNSADTDML